MKLLYHFTTARHIESIRRKGLTKGMIPWDVDYRTGLVRIKTGYQWLTREASFEQPWCFLGDLPMSRNDYRITVAIPDNDRPKLALWTTLVEKYGPQCAQDFARITGYTDWYVFSGKIPPHWFLEVKRNPHESLRPELEFLDKPKPKDPYSLN